MVSVTIMVGKTVTMKITIRVRQEPLWQDSGDDNDDDDKDIDEGNDKDSRELKQLLLLRRR